MSDTPLHEKVSLIEKRTAEFNHYTDRLNESIEDIEDRLQRAGFGFTVWTDWYLPNDDCPLIDESLDGRTGWCLGYDRMADGTWRIALKQVEVDGEQRMLRASGRVKALRDSSRTARVNGVAHMSTLMDCILQAVEDGIRGAKRAAEMARQPAQEAARHIVEMTMGDQPRPQPALLSAAPKEPTDALLRAAIRKLHRDCEVEGSEPMPPVDHACYVVGNEIVLNDLEREIARYRFTETKQGFRFRPVD